MIKIKNLTVRNFMSVGNSTQGINFDRTDLTLVLGENLDLGGDGSRNGTGKTTIINALSYALYGTALSNIRKDNLVNKTNAKNMMVSIDFGVAGKEYRIERGRKPNVLKFYVNNEEQTATDNAQGDSRETQSTIEDTLGLSHDMFKHILALNTYTEPFLSLKSNDQRTIIEQLLGITMLSDRADRIKERTRETKDSITAEEFRIRAVQEANKRIDEQIDSLKRRLSIWQKKHNDDLEYLVKQYDILSEIDIDVELQAHKDLAIWNSAKQKQDAYIALLARQTTWKQKQLNDVSDLNDSYVKLGHIDIAAELQSHVDVAAYLQKSKELAELKSLLARCESDEKKEANVVAKLKKEIAELTAHKCYACGQDFHDASYSSVMSAKEKSLQEAVSQVVATNCQWIEYNEAIVSIGNLGKLPTTHYKTEAAAIRHLSELENLDQQINARALEVDPYEDQLAEHANVVPGVQPKTHYDTEAAAVDHRSQCNNYLYQIETKNKDTDPYTDQIEEMKLHALQEVTYDTVNELTKLQEHQEFLLKLLTNKDSFIRKKIIEQNLSYLNTRLTYYLDRIGLPHTVVFQNDLSVSIEELGRELDFDNLSRGERNRLILSMSWAFRDVFESLYQPINLLFVDEMIDSGMDTQGVENSLALLKHMSRERQKSIWLVSHRDELAGRVENILKVVKENGFTSYNTDIDIDAT